MAGANWLIDWCWSSWLPKLVHLMSLNCVVWSSSVSIALFGHKITGDSSRNIMTNRQTTISTLLLVVLWAQLGAQIGSSSQETTDIWHQDLGAVRIR